VALALPELHPVWQAVAVLAVIWTTNLYNFMDGSDGLAGGMALFGFAAYAAAAWLAGDGIFAALAASIAAAAAAFLRFNFPPARVFMGDAGAIPLGFLAATLGLLGWREGYWPIWFPVLVFSPFVLDASVTLARRVLRGERFWVAHKIHYYQRLVRLGWGHRNTALAEYALMAACGGAALWALGQTPSAQWATVGAIAAAYGALGLAVDLAWRRRGEQVHDDAPAH
jgi:UDP-N-acetylmuramyl pentapeptide phosphotransferase/UDP-N-acetylglucosamine-1-phosphate transferase